VDGEVRLAGVCLEAVSPGALVAAFGVCALMLSEMVNVLEDAFTALDHAASVGIDLVRVDLPLVLREV